MSKLLSTDIFSLTDSRLLPPLTSHSFSKGVVIMVLFRAVVLLLPCLLFFGCFKSPDSISPHGMKIEYNIVDNKEVYTVNFSGVIRNENSGKAMKDVTGSISILNSSKQTLLVIPFSIDVIMPLSAATLYVQVEKDEAEISPLLDYFQIDRKELMRTGSTDGQSLNEENVILNKINFEKKDIIDLLKEKI